MKDLSRREKVLSEAPSIFTRKTLYVKVRFSIQAARASRV